ncbi:MAG: DNA translocase FtsK, partial [Clostridia bacterium]|nr:DNA translocase FtsK [Clostridia bacterium]
MATSKKKSSSRAKKPAAKKQTQSNRQISAVVWFAVAIFLGCIVFIRGGNVWRAMHDFMFGLFGVTAYIYPFLLAFVAVLVSMENVESSVGFKVGETVALAVLVAACVDSFVLYDKNVKFAQHASVAYSNGSFKNGGFIGALIGHPLCFLFSKPCAIIVLVLLIFVLLMAITGTTLASLFHWAATPVQKTREQVSNNYEQRAKRREELAADDKTKKGNIRILKGFEVDQPIDDDPPKKRVVDETTPEEKQRHLVDSYNNEEIVPEPKRRRISKRKAADEADTAVSEIAPETEVEIPPVVPPATSIEPEVDDTPYDAVAEEKAMTEQITSGIKMVDEDSYRFPPLSLLKAPDYRSGDVNAAEQMNQTGERLVETLHSFGVETRIVDICRGPTVTRYELQPCAGVKISKITNLADDIALNLATAGVRIEAPIPNKAAVGIEVPNKASATVGVREIIESPAFSSSKSKLSIALGKDIAGNAIVGDIAKMPHGLIAGATGSGKSVCINSIVMSILYKAKPDEVKLLMIDPKVVELGVYNGIPHLLVPVVTDPKKAAGALGWAVSEMEKRYAMFADRGVRDLAGYNKFVETIHEEEPEVEKMPQIVIIIDELADLMMTAPNEVEDSINRIAAKARAAGMHLLIATQRPSVDVVTGVIKANIPSRIAFAVSSQIDSRTILDSGGAEKLLGRGDMLYSPIGSTKPNRVQGCFVSDEEVESVAEFIKHSGDADYSDTIMDEIDKLAVMDKKQKNAGGSDEGGGDADPVLDDAIRVVVEAGQASTSLLQRKLKLGYARAARVVDQLEERGVVGPFEGPTPRTVLITPA